MYLTSFALAVIPHTLLLSRMSNSASIDSGSERETRYYTRKATELSIDPESLPLSDETREYLELLVDVADALGIDDLSFASYSTAIHELSMEELAARRSSLRMHRAEQELTAHLASLHHEEALIQHWKKTITAEPEPDRSVPAMERRKAALSAKIKQYRVEEETLKKELPPESSVSVTDLAALHKHVRAKDKVLAEKRAKVAAFQGLPPNIELARHELRTAQDEQMKLIQLRERLLDRMASGVS
ncbi:hypothetical protein DAEQUDRAFT_68808 [Daedalea quercina L-15889]|uniref:DUF4201 domain-containing protein n=1 Tax=Daedalea quercina L-15889 TaxID=1314783 RepID=A0A165L705_9APHY|nr:hypothetical protein DAEQUDRAFT_68808 [Daedalea quercina L-15889]